MCVLLVLKDVYVLTILHSHSHSHPSFSLQPHEVGFIIRQSRATLKAITFCPQIRVFLPCGSKSGQDGVLQNMSPRTCEFKKILCLNRVFVDVIKLTWGHFGVEWELIRRWVSLQEEENVDTDGHTRKEAGHMRMEAETGKHCHKPRSANCRSWNTQGRILLGAGGGSVAGPSDMLIQENKFLLF